MSEVDRRIQLASCYHPLLKEDFIENDSEFAEQVLFEIREFVTQRLAELMGVKENKTPTTYSPFNKEEINVLKAVAKKLIKKPELSEPEEAIVKTRAIKKETKTPAQEESTKPKTKVKKITKSQPAQAPVKEIPKASAQSEQNDNNDGDSKKKKHHPLARPTNAPKPYVPSFNERLMQAQEIVDSSKNSFGQNDTTFNPYE